MNVAILNEQRRGAILEVVRSEPSVASVAASWPGGLGGRAAFADGANGKSPVAYQFVSPEYFSVLGIDTRARTRLHADRAERKRRGGDRVGKRRAPAVAGSRRRRAGPATRAGPER